MRISRMESLLGSVPPVNAVRCKSGVPLGPADVPASACRSACRSSGSSDKACKSAPAAPRRPRSGRGSTLTAGPGSPAPSRSCFSAATRICKLAVRFAFLPSIQPLSAEPAASRERKLAPYRRLRPTRHRISTVIPGGGRFHRAFRIGHREVAPGTNAPDSVCNHTMQDSSGLGIRRRQQGQTVAAGAAVGISSFVPLFSGLCLSNGRAHWSGRR